jgi:hypothetical protein
MIRPVAKAEDHITEKQSPISRATKSISPPMKKGRRKGDPLATIRKD